MYHRTTFLYSLLIWSISSILYYLGLIKINIDLITSAVLIGYGLIVSNISFKESNRLQLVVSSLVFFIGIIILVKSNFTIVDTRTLFFISIFLITGAVSILLYIENTKQKVFLYSGLIIFVLGIILLLLIEKLGLIFIINQTAKLFENYFSFLLIIFALIIFLRKDKI